MPVLLLENGTRFQSLIGTSHFSHGSSANSQQASWAGVIGLLAMSAIVIGLAGLCVFILKSKRTPPPGIHIAASNACVEPYILKFHSTKRRCLRKVALINAARQASPPSSRLRPLLLGRSSELWSEQRNAVNDKQKLLKLQHRATHSLTVANRPRFPFNKPSLERSETLQHSQSLPNVQQMTPIPIPGTSLRRRSYPGKPILGRLDELQVEETLQNSGSEVPKDQFSRPLYPDLNQAGVCTDDVPRICIQCPTPPRPEASRIRKYTKTTHQPRRLRLERAQDSRKRHLIRQHTRELSTSSTHKTGNVDDPFMIAESHVKVSPKKQAVWRAKSGKRKNAHASKASPKKRATTSPRKPLGNLTNISCSLKTPPRTKPSLHINGIPADDAKTPPQMARIRSPPKNRAFLSTRWKPRPPRPSLTITVFVKERASRALYPGRRLTVNPSVGMTLAELKKEIEKVAGHKIGILKGMTLVGHTTMNVPLMSDRFYGQWVKERTAEGGVGVVEVMKVDS